MAMVLAYEDARKIHEEVSEEDLTQGGGKMVQTRFFGAKEMPTSPYARLSHRYPGCVIGPHFHLNDQFQVILDGEGKIGRHELKRYCIHYTRAYTPYGPFFASPAGPLKYFVLRPHYDIGSQLLPREHEQLRRVRDRRPWQITSKAIFPEATAEAIVLQAVPDIRDEDGLAVYTLSMKSHTSTHAPDAANSDGQYVAVVKGSLKHEQKEHEAPALVYVDPGEKPFVIHAGPQGLEALIFNFPRCHTQDPRTASNDSKSSGFKTWQCALCSFVYDEVRGMPSEGIAPGTRWQDVPENWSCPDCSASKADFQMVEI